MSTDTSIPEDPQWFALQIRPNQEKKVKTYIDRFKKDEELDDYIREVLMPTEVVSEVKNGKKTTKVRQLYPGYLFINMRLYYKPKPGEQKTEEQKKLITRPWYFVKETPEVTGFVGGEKPPALRDAEVDEIRARIEASSGKEVPKVTYEVGENVKINDGAFANLTGRIDEMDPERGRLKISVSIFGRFTPVELEYWQVERVTDG